MKKVKSEKAPAPIGPYSHGCIVNGILYCSGQISSDLSADIEVQAEQACRNVGAILAAAGAGYEDVFHTTCYLADMNDFAAFNAVYAKYFISKPARSCVAVRELPQGALCEIEAQAEVK